MAVHKNIKILTWFNFFTDFKLYAPLAIIYFTKVTGSFALGMSIFSISMISSALFEMPTGIYSDFIGRRKTVILGALAAVIYSIFYAVGTSYWILIIAALFDGLSQSFYSGNNDALLHDSLSENKNEHKYAEFLGKTSAMFQVALGVSAIVGGVLATWSFLLIMWLSVIPQIICFYLSLKLVEPKTKSKTSGNIYTHLEDAFNNFKTNKKLRTLSISSISGYALGEASYQFQSAFYSTFWPVWAISIAKTLSNVGATISFHFSGKITKKLGEIQTVIADNIYSRFVNIFSTAFPSIFSPLLMSTTSIFYGATSVAKNSLFQREFKSEQRATMGSLNSFAGSIVFGIVSFLLGLVADKISPARALLALNIIQFANLWLYFRVFNINKPVVVSKKLE